MKLFKILVVTVVSLLFIQCQSDEELGGTEFYNFATDLVVNYDTDTISMGDTLWFESEIVGFLVDSATQENIYFGNASINLNILVRAWNIENQNYQPDNYNFDYRTYISYESYTEKATMLGLYYYSYEGKYLLKFGVIFNKPGIYSIDGDYLEFKNYYNNNIEYFGGGIMSFQDLNFQDKVAYIKCQIITDNRNMHLYNGLSNQDIKSFQSVTEINENKYFFIKVNE